MGAAMKRDDLLPLPHNVQVLLRWVWGIFVIGIGIAAYVGTPQQFQMMLTDTTNQPLDILWLDWPTQRVAVYLLSFDIVVTVSFVCLGSLLFWRMQDRLIVVLVAFFLIAFPLTQVSFARPLHNYALPDGTYPTPSLLTAFVEVNDAVAAMTIFLVFCLFPDGRFTPPVIRWLAVLWGIVSVFWLVFPQFPYSIVYGDTWERTPMMSGVVSCLYLLGGFAVLVYRFVWRSNRAERQSTKWIVFGCAAVAISGFVRHGPNNPFDYGLQGDIIGTPVTAALVLIFAASLTFAVTQRGLWQVDWLVGNSIISVLLLGLVTATYTLLVGSLSLLMRDLLDDNLIILMATAVIALVLYPIYQFVQNNVNRMLFGNRKQPERVMLDLTDRIAGTSKHENVPNIIVEAVGKGLRLAGVSIAVCSKEGAPGVVAEWGHVERDPERFDVIAGEYEAYLCISQRTRDNIFAPEEYRLLDRISRQVRPAVEQYILHRNLERSKYRIVLERQETLAALGRRLHDEVSNEMASLKLQMLTPGHFVAAARKQDPNAVDTFVRNFDRIRDRARHIAHESYRPELLMLPFLTAVENRLHMTAFETQQIKFRFCATSPWPKHTSLALRTCIYRALENCLSNVVQHAKATECTVTIGVTHASGDRRPVPYRQVARLIVSDNGRARHGTGPLKYGVGLASIAQDADDLGGQFEACHQDPHGFFVRLELPIHE